MKALFIKFLVWLGIMSQPVPEIVDAGSQLRTKPVKVDRLPQRHILAMSRQVNSNKRPYIHEHRVRLWGNKKSAAILAEFDQKRV